MTGNETDRPVVDVNFKIKPAARVITPVQICDLDFRNGIRWGLVWGLWTRQNRRGPPAEKPTGGPAAEGGPG